MAETEAAVALLGMIPATTTTTTSTSKKRLASTIACPVEPRVIQIKPRKRDHINHTYRDFSIVPADLGYAPPKSAENMSFAEKLHDILSQPENEEFIAWMLHGRSFRVSIPKLFEIHACEKYFGHKRFSSFLRQLSNHGFKHLTQGADRNCYYHECFLRGLPHLCKYMPVPKDARRQIPDPDNEPKFTEISVNFPLPGNNPKNIGTFFEGACVPSMITFKKRAVSSLGGQFSSFSAVQQNILAAKAPAAQAVATPEKHVVNQADLTVQEELNKLRSRQRLAELVTQQKLQELQAQKRILELQAHHAAYELQSQQAMQQLESARASQNQQIQGLCQQLGIELPQGTRRTENEQIQEICQKLESGRIAQPSSATVTAADDCKAEETAAELTDFLRKHGLLF